VKRHLAHLLLALVVVWPALHIALSQSYGFSPWRFGGWGMYATPERRLPFVGLTAIVVPVGDESFDRLRRVLMVDARSTELTGQVLARHGVVVLGHGLGEDGAAVQYPHPILLAEQGKLVREVYTFSDRASLRELASFLDAVLVGGPASRVWYLVVSSRRIQIDGNETTTQSRVYRVAKGVVEELPELGESG